jgi:hypothetical protein
LVTGKQVPVNACNPFTDIPPMNEKRLHPVIVRDGYTEHDRISISLPGGYTVGSMPMEDVSLTSEFGVYSLKVTKGENAITFERYLEILPVRLPATSYNAWRDFYKEIAKADAAKLVLVEKKT